MSGTPGPTRPPKHSDSPAQTCGLMVSTSAMVAIEQQLLYFLDSLPSGRGRLVVIQGPQGFGKSHLLQEVYHQALQRGCAIRRAHGIPGGPLLSLAAQLTEQVVDPEVISDTASPEDLGVLSVFLIHMDGRLIAHASRESLGTDEDITSSMLTAIRGFVDHRLTTGRHAELDQMSVGAYRVQMVSGAHTYLAAVVRPTGEDRPIRRLLRRHLQGIESRYGSYLAVWHGELRGPLSAIVDEVASVLAPNPEIATLQGPSDEGTLGLREDVRRGVPGGITGSSHPTAPPNREEIEEALRSFLGDLPPVGGVVVVDDLEEVDAGSAELLQFLVRGTVDHPLLVVVGHRNRRSAPGQHPVAARLLRRWARERSATTLGLPSWSVADIQAVLEQVTLGQRWPVITPLVLRQVCQGHPGNTRSLILQWEEDPAQVRQLFAEGALEPSKLYDPRRIDPWPEVIASLDRSQRLVIAALHLWEGPLPIERLVTVSEIDELALWDRLESLLERDLVEEEPEGFAAVPALRPMGLGSFVEGADAVRLLEASQRALWEPLLESFAGPALFNLMAQRGPHGPPPNLESAQWARRWLRLHAGGFIVEPTDLRVRLLHGSACWVVGDLTSARGVLDGTQPLTPWAADAGRPPMTLPLLPPAQADQLDRFRRRLLAQVALTAGDVPAAANLVERLPPAPVTQSTPLFPTILARQRARILLASGQASQAEESLENAERWCYQVGDPFQSALVAMDRLLAQLLTTTPTDVPLERPEVPSVLELPLVQRIEALLYLARGLEVASRPRGALALHQHILLLATGAGASQAPLQLEKAFAQVGIGRALLELGKPALALAPLWQGCVGLWEGGLVPRAIPVCLALAQAEISAGSVIRGRDLAMTAGYLGKRLRLNAVEEGARRLLEDS